MNVYLVTLTIRSLVSEPRFRKERILVHAKDGAIAANKAHRLFFNLFLEENERIVSNNVEEFREDTEMLVIR